MLMKYFRLGDVGREADGNKHPNLIDIGERAGIGIPNIYDVWKKQKMEYVCINVSI